MEQATVILLARAIHVVGGVVWAGAAIIMGLAVMPVLLQHAEEGAGRWLGMIGMRVGILSGISALLTIISGMYLFHALHANDGSVGKIVLASGAMAAILALVVGIAFARPAGVKLMKLQQSGSPDPASIAALRTRTLISARLVVGLMTLSVLAMALFRYAQALA
ncbi:MAG TPA: hypothetical protein VF161_08120 [Steroidobacteraceae bacterium]|jgi:uncharacterized membrane protein